MKIILPLLLLASGAALGGCGTSQNIFLQSNPVPTSGPVAQADFYSAVSGRPIAIPASAGVLTNDTLNATGNSIISVSFPSTTAAGGAITLASDTGAFTYTPASGFAGTDTFSYTLSNGYGSASATVSVTVSATAAITSGYFVDSDSGKDTTGSFTTGAPYATVQAAVTAAGPGSDIVVLASRGNYSGTITLLDGQRLLGSGSGLVDLQGAARPTLTGPIFLADGNTVDFVRIARTNGSAIDGGGHNGGTVTNCEIVDSTNRGTGVKIRGVRGTWTVEGNTITNMSSIGIDSDTQNGDSATILVNGNTITRCADFGLGFAAIGESKLTAQVTNNVLTANQRGFTVESIASGTSTLSMQILGNQNDNVYRFDRLADGATINVEQFSQLTSLNTGTVVVGQSAITDVPAGFCGF